MTTKPSPAPSTSDQPLGQAQDYQGAGGTTSADYQKQLADPNSDFQSGNIFGDNNLGQIQLPSGQGQPGPSNDAFGQNIPVPTFTTVLKQFRAFMHETPTQRQIVAQRLVEAGYLTKNKKNRYDPTSVESAFKQALVDAAGAQMSLNDWIDQSSQAIGDALDGAGTQKATIRLTNPADLAVTFDKVAQSVLGRKLDPGTISNMVNTFHSFETQEGNAVNNQADSTTAAPNPQTYAEQALRGANPVEASANDTLGYANDFFSLLGGVNGGSGKQ